MLSFFNQKFTDISGKAINELVTENSFKVSFQENKVKWKDRFIAHSQLNSYSKIEVDFNNKKNDHYLEDVTILYSDFHIRGMNYYRRKTINYNQPTVIEVDPHEDRGNENLSGVTRVVPDDIQLNLKKYYQVMGSGFHYSGEKGKETFYLILKDHIEKRGIAGKFWHYYIENLSFSDANLDYRPVKDFLYKMYEVVFNYDVLDYPKIEAFLWPTLASTFFHYLHTLASFNYALIKNGIDVYMLSSDGKQLIPFEWIPLPILNVRYTLSYTRMRYSPT